MKKIYLWAFTWLLMALLCGACAQELHENQPADTPGPVIGFDKKDLNTIQIASIEWCPQLCADLTGKRPGYIAEIVRSAFAQQGIQVKAHAFPWSRAIMYTNSGDLDALLSPVKKEAPHLLFPEYEVGIQRMCFFTKRGDSWRYRGRKSLLGRRVLLAQDGSAEELNDFIKLHPEIFRPLPYSETFLDSVFEALYAGKQDTLLFTYNSTIYYLKENKRYELYRLAGCVNSANLYIGFSPSKTNRKRSEFFRKQFNLGMGKLIRQGKIPAIMRRYGLSYWR